MRCKLVAQALEFRPEFKVVINFAVKYYSPVAGVFQNRLISALQIDDFQACCAA